MKWLAIIVSVVALIVVYQFLQNDDARRPELSAPVLSTAPRAESPAAGAAPAVPTASTGGSGDVIDPERQAAADAVEREIKVLMADYDRYRHDDQRREEIQAEIDRLMAKYNELILPIAVSKVKEGG